MLCPASLFFRSGIYQLFSVGIKGRMAMATLLMGMVWSHTLPGPVSSVLKIPSPPKKPAPAQFQQIQFFPESWTRR